MKGIYKTLAMGLKELRVFIKDWVMVFTIFLLPIIVSAIVGSPFLLSEEESIILPIALVDHDQGKYSDDILDILEDIDELEITEMEDREKALALVGEGEVLAMVYIPEDFTARVEAYESTEVTVVIDPAQAQYSTMITTIMEEVTEPVLIQGEIRYGTQSVMDDLIGSEDDPNAKTASTAQTEGVINTRMEEIRDNPRVEVRKENLKDAVALVPNNVFSMFLPGFTVLFAFFLVPTLAKQLINEKDEGTLRRLIAAPLSRSSIIGGKVWSHMTIVILQVALVFGFANIVFNMPLGESPLGLMLVTLGLAFAATALGMMLAALAKSRRQAESIGLMIIFGIGALGGCFQLSPMPLYRTEGFLGSISKFTPQAQALEGYRQLLIEGATAVDVLPQVAILVGMGIVFFAIALWRFKFE